MTVPLSFHRFGCKLILQCFSSKYLLCYALWMLPAKIPSAIFPRPTPPHSLLPMCSFLPWVSNSTNPKWTPKICLKMHCLTIPRKLDQPTGWIYNCQITHVTKHQFNDSASMLKVAILTWKEVHPPKKVHHHFRFGHSEAHKHTWYHCSWYPAPREMTIVIG